MSPLHLEHLLGFKLLCLVTRAPSSAARTARHRLSHRLSSASLMLAVLAKPLPLATSLQALAARASWLGGLPGHAALGRRWQGSSGPCVAQPQTWPLPTTATELVPARTWPNGRGARSTSAPSCAPIPRKRHPFAATTPASVTALRGCARPPGLTASLATARGWERAGEASCVEGMCSQPLALLPADQFTCKINN